MNLNKLFHEGQTAHQKGQLKAANQAYDQVLSKAPDHSGALLFKGVLMKQFGELRQAVQLMARSIQNASPPTLHHHVNYGSALRQVGQLDEAAEQYNAALRLAPGNQQAKNNLGVLEMQRGNLRQSLRIFQELTQTTELAEPWVNIGKIEERLQNIEAAKEAYTKCSDLFPGHAEAFARLGRILIAEKDIEGGRANLEKAVDLNPSENVALPLLLDHYEKYDEPDRLLAVANRAADGSHLHVSALFTIISKKRKALDWGGIDDLERRAEQAALQNHKNIRLNTSATFTALYSRIQPLALRYIAEAFGGLLNARPGFDLSQRESLRNGRRLRIGYLSYDLRAHAVGYLIAGLFAQHDRSRVEVLAYNASFDDDSSVRSKMRESCDRWINVSDLSDESLAQKIYDDQVDVLVDLNGLTTGQRLLALTQRPAPVQMHYLGMPGSTGCEFIDYFIGDAVTVNAQSRTQFSEKIIHLHRCYQPNDDTHAVAEVETSRDDHGLPESAFVFCCFNQLHRITPDLLAAWAEILKKTSNTVLWVLTSSEIANENLLKALEGLGVDRNRVIFAPKIPNDRHQERIRHADLFLDTIPYNAHTTCTDALRSGVPILTVTGDTFAARVAESILTELDLVDDLVAHDLTDYVARAIDYVQDLDHFTRMRDQVQEQYRTSSLVDNADLARGLEAAYEAAFNRWIEGAPAADLWVNGDLSVSEQASEDTAMTSDVQR